MQKFFLFQKIAFIITAGIFFAATAIASNQSGLLLYASFQNDAVPVTSNGNSQPLYNENVEMGSGKFGGAASIIGNTSQLVFDGPGNVYSQAGTISFFWRADVDTAGKNVTILNLSPSEKTDSERYILLSYIAGKFRLYLSAGDLGGQTLTSKPVLILPGQWHHIALCWDQTDGMVLYVDGESACEFHKQWTYDGAIGGIGFGVINRPGRPPLAPFSQSFDEFRVYDRWLEDAALEKLKDGKAAASTAPLSTSAFASRQLLMNHWVISSQWDLAKTASFPQLKVGIGGGLGLRQASIANVQSPGDVLFDGERAAYWPKDKSTFNQSLQITLQKNQPFDVVQMLGAGKLVLTDDDNKKKLADFDSVGSSYQSFIMPAPVAATQLSLQTLAPADLLTQKTSAAVVMGFQKQIRYPYEFDNSWQKFSLRSATGSDQSSNASLQIRQAFYSSDQQTLMAQDGTASGEITIPAMRTFHIVGPEHSETQTLDAIAVELKLQRRAPAFLRAQITDPQNPLHFLTAADIHLNDGPGTLRLLLDHRNVDLPPGTRPILSLTFSDDVTIDLAGSAVRYQWK